MGVTLRDPIKRKFLSDVAMQRENLGKSEKGGKPSILKDKSYEALKTFSSCKILEEGQKRCPDVIDFYQFNNMCTCTPGGSKQSQKGRNQDTNHWSCICSDDASD